MGRLDQLGDAVRQTIRAYHASPYEFEKFDFRHMGTGEGFQAFGPGGYFAQSPAVMEEYYKQFWRFRPTKDGVWSNRTVQDAEDALQHYGGDREKTIASIESMLPDVVDDLSLRPQFEDAIAYLRQAAPPRVTRYEVKILHPEKSLLDYDAPLSKQNDAVRSVIDESDLYDLAADGGIIGPDFDPSSALGPILAGHAAARGRQAAFGAFDRLRDAGVPGMRYWDAFSRSGAPLPKRTRNYVMFPGTEDSIRILRKFAVPGVVGAGAAAMSGEE
jgi:hypothetical protein